MSSNQINDEQIIPSGRYGYYQDDEIDLKELFLALWQGKWIIIATTFIFAVGAVIYALTAQEWWSAKAKIAKPQVSDFAQLRQQVMQFQPIFDVYQDDGTVLVSQELGRLITPDTLFTQFIRSFNSTNSKKKFFDNNETVVEFKTKLIAGNEDSEEVKRRLYNDWYQKVVALPVEKNITNVYSVSLQATSKQVSYKLLKEYVDDIKQEVHNDILDDINAVITTKRKQLLQQKTVFTAQANNKLNIELLRSKYAYDIANAASLSKPVENLGNNEVFAINLGADALNAKVNALKNVKDLSIVEPRLMQIDAKLELLDTLKIDSSIKFDSFRFLEDVEQPISRDKPKRALIVVLGALLGGMLGVMVVLIRFAFRKEND